MDHYISRGGGGGWSWTVFSSNYVFIFVQCLCVHVCVVVCFFVIFIPYFSFVWLSLHFLCYIFYYFIVQDFFLGACITSPIPPSKI